MNFEIPGAPKGKADAISALTEGAAVTFGLFAAGIAGKQMEKIAKNGVTPASTLSDKIIAYSANNVTKVIEWLALNYVDEKVKPTGFANVLVKDGKKGIMASVALDTFMRLNNNMAPVTFPTLFGFTLMGNQGTPTSNGNPAQVQQLKSNLQRMVQENSSLRGQLNGAMTRLASAPTVNVQELAPHQDHGTRFGMMTEEASRRRKDFGAMVTPPMVAERNRRFGAMDDERARKFGAMDKKALNFAGEEESVSAMYGML